MRAGLRLGDAGRVWEFPARVRFHDRAARDERRHIARHHTFSGSRRVRGSVTWLWARLPGSATIFDIRGLVKVSGTVNDHPGDGAFMALGDGTHKLPIAAAILHAVGRSEGVDVTIHPTHRRT
ncbi:MAG: DUF1905 domain-containing protein [Microbacterium sp.]|uniref:DUF1905 domain-containing protein n=1 Tax=Microbacterium sp. TaxID=51671 RepID=UPI001AD405B8|nr:DUF1905 domain-containing protein [Microbacterium sp.]MBN9178895.1 DUF1905 domain-containing protein [Microbacterium sp.]